MVNTQLYCSTRLLFQKWDRYGLGFGSDGFLYDFVKRTPTSKYNKYNGFGSDGYLYDFTKENPQSCKINFMKDRRNRKKI